MTEILRFDPVLGTFLCISHLSGISSDSLVCKKNLGEIFLSLNIILRNF